MRTFSRSSIAPSWSSPSVSGRFRHREGRRPAGHVAARFPDREALVVPFQGVRLTYAELDAEVDRLARALMARGLEVGDRLGIWSPNNAEWVLVQYATARAGIILVNLNPAYRTHEVR